MSSVYQFQEILTRARGGDSSSLAIIRNIIRETSRTAPNDAILSIGNLLLDIRMEEARKEAEDN